MNIQKFKVKVFVVKELEIEVNTDIINKEFFEGFSGYMWQVDSLEEIVEHVAYCHAHNDEDFVEGVGEVKQKYEGPNPLEVSGVKAKYNGWNYDVTVEIQ